MSDISASSAMVAAIGTLRPCLKPDGLQVAWARVCRAPFVHGRVGARGRARACAGCAHAMTLRDVASAELPLAPWKRHARGVHRALECACVQLYRDIVALLVSAAEDGCARLNTPGGKICN